MGTFKIDGYLHAGSNLRLWSDTEGANIRFITPGNSNNVYELDTCANQLRLYYCTDGGHGSEGWQAWYFGTDGTLSAKTFSGALKGNADTATKLATARTISLTGSVTGSGTFDGSGNLSIATTTNHTHDSRYVNIDGDTMTGRLTLNVYNNGTAPSQQSIVINGVETTDVGLMPGISMHIPNKTYGSLKMHSDGSWRFYNSSCSGYMPVYASTFYGALSGNASTATNADKVDGYHADSFLLKSGGTVTGTLTVSNSNSGGGYVSIYEDGEGGTIRIGSKNGTYNWEMDAYNDTCFRIFSNGSGSYKFFTFNGSNGDFSATTFTGALNGNATSANTAGGIHSVSPVLAASGESNTLQAINNYYYYTDTTLPIYHSLLAMVKVLDFQWFNSHWRIGNIRSGSTASYGFGFSYSADNQTHNLYTYINPSGCLWSKRLGSDNYGPTLPSASVRGEVFFLVSSR